MGVLTQFGVTPEEANDALIESIIEEAAEARSNPARFFEFVMREETSRERIATLPHQEVLFAFIEHYERCVIRMPTGFSKTYSLSAYGMYKLGQDNTTRGVVISNSQDQAEKPVSLIRDYIEESADLRLVFPNLRRNEDDERWTQSKLVIERPHGIRDPSIRAIGYGGRILGSRLNWILVDDLLDEVNTSTAEQRKKLKRWFFSRILSRRDIVGTKIVVCNTPWHPEDLTYTLQNAGWPTLEMDIEGNIRFFNADDFDCDAIRPSDVDSSGANHRLAAHDAPRFAAFAPANDNAQAAVLVDWRDEHDQVPLWPDKFPRAEIEKLKEEYDSEPGAFNHLYMMLCRDEESSHVKSDWVTKCKAAAREARVHAFRGGWDGNAFPAYTGVDLAVGKRKGTGKTALFTFAVLPKGKRQVLDIQRGRWSGKEIITKLVETTQKFNSIAAVENNGMQDLLLQWAKEEHASLAVRAHHTGNNKANPHHGLASIFLELENAAWLIPNDSRGKCPVEAQDWVDEMLAYDPNEHTGDILMASWIARELARKMGALKRGVVTESGVQGGEAGRIAQAIGMR